MNEVKEYYARNAEREWHRLEGHRTEFAVTMRILSRFLPAPPAKVIDIGGGPGRYSLFLSAQGYEVTLVDLAQANLDLAGEKAQEAGISIADYLCADARSLENVPAAAFDAVLLMGPLAHLLSREDRKQALSEAGRVLKVNGLIFASFLCRFAPFRHAAKTNPAWLTSNKEYASRLLRTGWHDSPQTFTYAYFARPEEIAPFMQECGFAAQELIGCEGIVANTEESINDLKGEDGEAWVELNYQLGREASLLGASDHLLYVGSRENGMSAECLR